MDITRSSAAANTGQPLGDESARPFSASVASQSSRRARLCLAASGGGHVRQILDLEPLWQDHDHFVVTEETALGRSIAEKQPTRFVPHFALGQARLGSPLKMLVAAFRSMVASWRIIADERPDVVITTGAGSQLFIALWARLLGARVYLVDSFARFDAPSAFARLAGPLAHVRIAQSAKSAEHWPGAIVFDPFRLLGGFRPAKEALMLVTVGATLPFDRMVEMVARAKAVGLIPERIVIQTGLGGASPSAPDIEVVETIGFSEIQTLLRRADLVVCHGGTGSLITALREGCRIVAVPRRFSRGEHYDDHQAEITDAFAARGLIEMADDEPSFARALAAARAREPRSATTDPSALIAFLRKDIADWWETRSSKRASGAAKS